MLQWQVVLVVNLSPIDPLLMLFFRASCTWKVFEAWKKAKQLSLHSRSHQRVWSHSELLAREAFTVWAVKGDRKARRSRNDAQRGTGKVETFSLRTCTPTNCVNKCHCFFHIIIYIFQIYKSFSFCMCCFIACNGRHVQFGHYCFKLLSIFFPFSWIPTPTYNLIKGQRRGSDEWTESITFKSTLPKWNLADWLPKPLCGFLHLCHQNKI